MMEVFIRLLMRYIAGSLLAKGLIDAAMAHQLATDQEVIAALQIIIAFAFGAVAEGWYYLAKKFGWRT